MGEAHKNIKQGIEKNSLLFHYLRKNPQIIEAKEQMLKDRLKLNYQKGEKVIFDSQTSGICCIWNGTIGEVVEDLVDSVSAYFEDCNGQVKLFGSIYKKDVNKI